MKELKQILKQISGLSNNGLRESKIQKNLLKKAKEELDVFKIPKLKQDLQKQLELSVDCLQSLIKREMREN